MNAALQGLITILLGVGGCVAYYTLSNLLVDTLLFPARGPHQARNIRRANLVRPWLFLAPALFVLAVYLAYPVIETLRLSLSERVAGDGSRFVGFANYVQMLSESKFREAMRNNLLWLVVVPAAATAF